MPTRKSSSERSENRKVLIFAICLVCLVLGAAAYGIVGFRKGGGSPSVTGNSDNTTTSNATDNSSNYAPDTNRTNDSFPTKPPFDDNTSNYSAFHMPGFSEMPIFPCSENPNCQRVTDALIEAYPSSRFTSLDEFGTCANWTRHYLRLERDVTSYSNSRIRQRFVLILLYCEWNGYQWYLNNDAWLSSLHECDWFNSFDPCDSSDNLRRLQFFPSNHVQGTLPPELSMLTSLWELLVPGVSERYGLYGTIPSELEKLTQLGRLVLSNHALEGNLPDFVFEYSGLRVLDLSFNQLNGTAFSNAPSFPSNMEVVRLSHNRLSGRIPTSIGQLSDLTVLKLEHNRLTGSIPGSVYIPSLSHLFLNDNDFTGNFPSNQFVTAAQVLGASGLISPLQLLTLHGNPGVTGGVEELCLLTDPSYGNLEEIRTGPTLDCSCCRVIP